MFLVNILQCLQVANDLGSLLLRETFYQIKFANSGSCATTEADRGHFAL